MPHISPKSRTFRTSPFLLLLSLVAASASAQAPSATSESAASPGPANTETAHAEGAAANEPQPVSQVRIVRLSEIHGEAQLDRNTGRGFESAFANIPITAGSRLRTAAGLAEVEFEDNSTVRLTPDSEVDFLTLGRTAAGATVTRLHVVSGTVYVTLTRTKAAAAFTLSAGQSTLQPSPGAHLRLTIGSLDRAALDRAGLHQGGNDQPTPGDPQAHSTLAVFDGTVNLTVPTGSTLLSKKSMTIFGAAEPARLTLANKVEPAPFDTWDKQAGAFQSRYATSSFSGGTGALYGSSDLNYYGGFADLPGCGSVWRPYFTNAAWDPYGAGTWALYPGAGYSFISPYPWGWLPFHSGSWQQCGAAGWGWSPNGQWNGLRNIATVVNGTGQRPHAPIKVPVGKAPFVVVGTHPVEASRLTAPDTFTFRQNSAGLGVPREVFGKLSSTSRSVERHGTASMEAGVGVLSGGSNDRAAGASRAPLASPRTVAIITRPSSGESFPASPTAGSNSGGVGPLGTRAGSSMAPAVSAHASVGGPGSPSGGGAHK